MALADLCVVISHGRIEDTGQPERVYRRPRTRFTATFMGESTIFRRAPRPRHAGHFACGWREPRFRRHPSGERRHRRCARRPRRPRRRHRQRPRLPGRLQAAPTWSEPSQLTVHLPVGTRLRSASASSCIAARTRSSRWTSEPWPRSRLSAPATGTRRSAWRMTSRWSTSRGSNRSSAATCGTCAAATAICCSTAASATSACVVACPW